MPNDQENVVCRAEENSQFPTENTSSLLNLVEPGVIQKIMESFIKATDIVVDIIGRDGSTIIQYEHYYGFCKAIRSTPKGLERCMHSNAVLGRKAAAAGGAMFSHCHAGVSLIGAPIVVENHYFGCIVCGQTHIEEPNQELIEKMLEQTKDLGLDQAQLVEDFKQIKIISKEKFRASLDLISLVANHIAEVAYKSNIRAELNKKKLELVELEKLLKTAELKNLQAQIEPHFLFNTLNILTRLITIGETEKALQVTYALAKLFRYNLEQPASLVTLREEMAYIDSYLLIQKIRFGNRLRVEVDISPELLNISIPLLTLQPLVENACVHGIEPKAEGGCVWIVGREKDNKVMIDVKDDGVGIPDEVLEAFENYKNNNDLTGNTNLEMMALKNVHRRLSLRFGPGYGLSLKKSDDNRTIASITLPFL